MTTTQIELTQLDAQLSEAADLLRDGVDAEMAEIDNALRALAEELTARSREAMAAVDEGAQRRLRTLPSQLGNR